MRQSIQPTFDSRKTGPQYSVTSTINGHLVGKHHISDPFVRHTIHIGWLDLIRSLLRGSLTVEVHIDAERDRIEDVLELDANYLGFSHSTRHQEFTAAINRALGDLT